MKTLRSILSAPLELLVLVLFFLMAITAWAAMRLGGEE